MNFWGEMGGVGETAAKLPGEQRLAIGASRFVVFDDETTLAAGAWLRIAQGGATGQAARLSGRVGGVAIRTGDAPEAFRQLETRSDGLGGALYNAPYFVGESKVFDILSDVIQAGKQVEGILEDSQRADAQTGGNTDPGLLAQFYRNPVFNF